MKKIYKGLISFIVFALVFLASGLLLFRPAINASAAGSPTIVATYTPSVIKTNTKNPVVEVSLTTNNITGEPFAVSIKISFDTQYFEFDASKDFVESTDSSINSYISFASTDETDLSKGYFTIMNEDLKGDPITKSTWNMGKARIRVKAGVTLPSGAISKITCSDSILADLEGNLIEHTISGGEGSISFTAPSSECDIKTLSVCGKSVPIPASGTDLGTVEVPYTTTKLTYTETHSTGADVAFTPTNNSNLPLGLTNVTIAVTAEDGVAKKNYTLKVNRADGDKVKTLDSLTFKANGNAVVTKTSAELATAGTYDAGKIAFANKDKLSVEFAKTSNNSTVEVYDGTRKVSSPYSLGVIASGTHTVTIKVIPQHTESNPANEYKITFEVEAPEGKATLTALSLKIVKGDGEEPVNFTETFSPETLNYSATVPQSTTKIKIEATASGKLANVSGTGEFEVSLPCSKEIIVTAQSEEVTKYTIVITAEKDVSGLTLKNLSAVGIEADGREHVLDMSLTSVADYYKVSIPFTLNISGFMIKADKFTDPDYTVEGINYKVSIVRGEMPKIHEVRFVKNDVAEKIVVFDIYYESDVCSLEKLTYDGREIELGDKTDFALEFGTTVDSVKIGAVATDRNATVTLICTRDSKSGKDELNVELQGGLNLVIVKVTATNGNMGFYTLALTRLQSGAKTLQSLDLGGKKFEVTDNTRVYEMEVESDVNKISIKAGAVAGATVSIDYADVAEEISSGDKVINLKSGSNVVLVKVTAEDGSVGVYTVSVTRKIQKAEAYTPYVVAIVVISVISVLIIIALTVVIIVNRRRG